MPSPMVRPAAQAEPGKAANRQQTAAIQIIPAILFLMEFTSFVSWASRNGHPILMATTK